MTNQDFYSDRTNGRSPAIHSTLPEATRMGLLALIHTKIAANWLANSFPAYCPDGKGVAGTDERALGMNLKAIVPKAPFPVLRGDEETEDETLFDMIEYVSRCIAEPKEGPYHNFYGHHELTFKKNAGFEEFQSEVNLLFSRGLAMYKLSDDREVHRTGTAAARTVLAALNPRTGDDELDRMLVDAREAYTSSHAAKRRGSVEKLWDAFERLKTIDAPSKDKKKSIAILLSSCEPEWRTLLEEEMLALTKIGNTFQIRHFETGTHAFSDRYVDYLFTRMGGLIVELLSLSNRLETI